MDEEVIEGALATLKRAKPTPEMLEGLKSRLPALTSPLDLEFLNHLCARGALEVWEIYPQGSPDVVGYGVFVGYDGPPYMNIFFFCEVVGEVPDKALCLDCFMQLMHVFFRSTEESALFLYDEKPVDEDYHNFFLESGFDIFDDNPTIDNDLEACYVLERYTYDAYYGVSADDDTPDYSGGY